MDVPVPWTKNTIPPAFPCKPLGQVIAASIVLVAIEYGGSSHPEAVGTAAADAAAIRPATRARENIISTLVDERAWG